MMKGNKCPKCGNCGFGWLLLDECEFCSFNYKKKLKVVKI